MTRVLVPRIRSGASPVAVAATRVPSAVGAALLIAVALVAALLPGPPGFRIVMVAFAVFAALSAPLLVAWARVVVAGRVRIDPAARALRFVVPPVIPIGMMALAAVALAGGLVALVLRTADIPGAEQAGVGRYTPYAVGVVGLLWLAQQAWALRVPAGLTLDAGGIRGVRGTRAVGLSWDDVAGVSVVAARGARLVLERRDGGVVVLDPHWFGSDPNVVARIVEHFLRHPADRALLTDGRAAVRAVEDAH